MLTVLLAHERPWSAGSEVRHKCMFSHCASSSVFSPLLTFIFLFFTFPFSFVIYSRFSYSPSTSLIIFSFSFKILFTSCFYYLFKFSFRLFLFFYLTGLWLLFLHPFLGLDLPQGLLTRDPSVSFTGPANLCSSTQNFMNMHFLVGEFPWFFTGFQRISQILQV